ncbi:MAG: HEAT repeat domain-containing protein [Acidobacteriota bacterium]|nr:HEAT repeat domain-containing protein [Acidobacteriota bacterium]
MRKQGLLKTLGITAIAVTLVLTQVAVPATAQAPSFLTGKVKAMEAAGTTLAARQDAARREAGSAGYFTAWMFESRHKITSRGDGKIVQTYSVGSEGAKIKVRSRDESNSNNISTDDGKDVPSPSGLLFLHDAAGMVVDATVLDPEQTYEFGPTTVYWLGRAGNEDSMARIEAAFAKASGEHLKSTLLFLASCHSGERGYGFVKAVARGSEPVKVREQAVFWLGASQDARSLADLKAVYAGEKTVSIKKQIVFAIQLNKSREASAELIALAKTEPDREIRKTAVFWLGQKASEESVKALKDIVQAKGGEDTVKEQAVFAISQMPKDKSVPMLIDIAKTNPSPEIRKKAIFWLGQSGDESAIKYFEEILLKK